MSLRAASEHVGILRLLLQTRVWMELWVRACALLNFLNQIPYYGSQCTASPWAALSLAEFCCFSLYQGTICLFFGFFFVEVICAFIPQLPGARCVGAKPRGPVSQSISANQ